MKVRVSIVEDDPGTLATLIELVNGCQSLECVSGHNSGEDIVKAAPEVRPDVVVVDLRLKDMRGAECIYHVSRLLPEAAVLVYSMHEEPEWIFPALQAGAHGYIVKGGPPSQLIDAIEAAHRGEFPLGTGVAGEILRHLRKPDLSAALTPPLEAGGSDGTGRVSAAGFGLTTQEESILELVSKRAKYHEIAATLGLSLRTINNRMKEILRKLHAANRNEAVAKYTALRPKP